MDSASDTPAEPAFEAEPQEAPDPLEGNTTTPEGLSTNASKPPPVDVWLGPGENRLTLNQKDNQDVVWEFVLGLNATATPTEAFVSPPHAVLILPWNSTLGACTTIPFHAHSLAGNDHWMHDLSPGIYRVIVAEGTGEGHVAGTGVYYFQSGNETATRKLDVKGRESKWTARWYEEDTEPAFDRSVPAGYATLGFSASNFMDAESDAFTSRITNIGATCDEAAFTISAEPAAVNFGGSGRVTHFVASSKQSTWTVEHQRTDRVPAGGEPSTWISGTVFIPPGI